MKQADGLTRRSHGIAERQEIDPASPWWTVHVARYRFAAPRVVGQRVLDIACGTGYGMTILRDAGAQTVIGVDLDLGSVRQAQAQLNGGRGGAILADGRRLPFADHRFDAVTSFETLEHLNERQRFIAELRRVLDPDGWCLLSTPNANHTQPINGAPRNPYHVHEYTPQELQAELSAHFASVTLLGQILDERFRIPPFWDEQDRLARSMGMRAQVLLWRALYKVPWALRDRVSFRLWGQPLVPTEGDYRFEASAIARAPVLVALCRGGL